MGLDMCGWTGLKTKIYISRSSLALQCTQAHQAFKCLHMEQCSYHIRQSGPVWRSVAMYCSMETGQRAIMQFHRPGKALERRQKTRSGKDVRGSVF